MPQVVKLCLACTLPPVLPPPVLPPLEDATNAATFSRIPTEQRRGSGGWAQRCVRTLVGVTGRPWALFSLCPEPVQHAVVLGYLATLRLLPWAGLVIYLALQYFGGEPQATPTRPIHGYIEPALTEVLAAWSMLMIPVGLPLLYLCGGLVAHIGVALTGGAARSIGASMRAVGYALGPALLTIGCLDVPLYTTGIDSQTYFVVVGVALLIFLYILGFSLARTHQIHPLRGFIVAVPPMLVLAATTLSRAALMLDEVPLLTGPDSKYWVP